MGPILFKITQLLLKYGYSIPLPATWRLPNLMAHHLQNPFYESETIYDFIFSLKTVLTSAFLKTALTFT